MMAKVRKTATCWLFEGATNGRAGHGQVRVKKKGVWRKDYAHRIAYEQYYGPIPGGMCVRHSCDTSNCVHPEHIKELGSIAQNNLDMYYRNRMANQYGPFQTVDDSSEDLCPF